MTLKDDEIDALDKHINETWKSFECEICGRKDWRGSSKVHLRPTEEGDLDLTGPVIPCAVITCEYCGNTRLINLVVAGAYEQPKED